MIKVTFPEKVRLQDIDTEDDTYSISFPKDIKELKESIQKIGLLTPLILRKQNGTKKFQIIAGYKRGIVLNELSAEVIPAYIFNKEELNNKNALKMNFLENLYTRELNSIEISEFLFKLKECINISDDKIVNVYLPLIGLEKSLHILNKYLSLQNLITGFKELAVIKKIHLKILSRLSLLSCKDQESLFGLVKNLELGFNFVNELLTLLEEISKRDGNAIFDLISDREINEILIKDKISRDQKIKSIMSFLKEKRYPLIKEFEMKINKHIKNLKLPNSISINLAENFENEAITMKLKFKDKKEYQEILSSLSRISDSEDLSAIIESV